MPQTSNRTESEMIFAVLAGEIQLYHDLIRPYERSVYVMALSYMKNEADAEALHKKHSLGRSAGFLLSAANRNSARGLSASRSERGEDTPPQTGSRSNGTSRSTAGRG